MDDVAARVSTPSILLRVLGILFAVMSIIGMFWSCLGPVFQVLMGAIQAGTAQSEDELQAALISAVFGSTMSIVTAIIRLVAGLLGVIAGAASFVGGGRLMEMRSRGLVQLGAILVVVQPVLSLVTACFTSSCGCWGFALWIPLTVVGIVAAVLTFTSIGDADVSAQFDANDAA